jgi:hypothetical protein
MGQMLKSLLSIPGGFSCPFVLAAIAACGGRVDLPRVSTSGVTEGADTGSTSGIDANDGESGSEASYLDGAQPAGALPACAWPTPLSPSDARVEVSANRTVLMCGVGDTNNTYCLSASATECTPVSVYGSCGQQCSPCTMLCAPNEYAIGVGMPVYSQPPPDPPQSPTLPSNCKNVIPDGFALSPSLPSNVFWGYWCCTCE